VIGKRADSGADSGEPRRLCDHTNGFCVCSRYNEGYAVAQLVEALRYKPKGRGLDS
jgi:hypothetical protein